MTTQMDDGIFVYSDGEDGMTHLGGGSVSNRTRGKMKTRTAKEKRRKTFRKKRKKALEEKEQERKRRAPPISSSDEDEENKEDGGGGGGEVRARGRHA